MKVAGMRAVRAQMASLFGGDEPVLLTRHGKISGLYLPLEEPDRLPDDLGRELASVLGQHLARLLDTQGLSEDQIQEDFDAHRRPRG
ncbi:MAG: hypothetical protein V3T83_06545 [Acidobacteriota bacterium]